MAFPIEEMLCRYEARARLRLHMPGHGGALDGKDVTELDATDDLLHPQGAIRESEFLATKLFSSELTLYCCSGATLALQAAIAFQLSLLPTGARVLCERNVHRSIIHAFALLEVQPEWICLETAQESDFTGAKLLVFSGCDYFGRVPDYRRIAAFCSKNGVRTVVDNAHGTHLRFYEEGKLHPLFYGFDLIVDSAHKTLPVLTGGALLHAGTPLLPDREELYEGLKRSFALFSTTSPSFLILRSLENALEHIAGEWDGKQCASLTKRLQLLTELRAALSLCAVGEHEDPFRLILRGEYDFARLSQLLSEQGIFCEFFTRDALVMLPSWNFDAADACRLREALSEILPLCRTEPKQGAELSLKSIVPQREMTLREALCGASKTVASAQAEGQISAEVLCAYPPGTALVMPGERISKWAIEASGKEKIRVVLHAEGN